MTDRENLSLNDDVKKIVVTGIIPYIEEEVKSDWMKTQVWAKNPNAFENIERAINAYKLLFEEEKDDDNEG